jgi:hypothetical protein
MSKQTIITCLTSAALLGCAGVSFSSAQTVHHVVEITDFLPDETIAVTDFLPDERWQVVGACSNAPTLRVQITDFLPDKRIAITNFLPDKRVCISGANNLDRKTLKLLGLID